MDKDIIRKCPKCNKAPDFYTEVWAGHGIEFNIEDGVINREGEMFPGHPEKVEATCSDCEYTWTLRGVNQITELFL